MVNNKYHVTEPGRPAYRLLNVARNQPELGTPGRPQFITVNGDRRFKHYQGFSLYGL